MRKSSLWQTKVHSDAAFFCTVDIKWSVVQPQLSLDLELDPGSAKQGWTVFFEFSLRHPLLGDFVDPSILLRGAFAIGQCGITFGIFTRCQYNPMQFIGWIEKTSS